MSLKYEIFGGFYFFLRFFNFRVTKGFKDCFDSFSGGEKVGGLGKVDYKKNIWRYL